MSDLKTTLDEYAKDLKALTGIKPQQFDIVQVSSMIRAIPERKWNAAQAIVDATVTKKTADGNLKAIKATRLLEASRGKEATGLSNAQDRSAWVDSQPEIQEAELEVINSEATLLAAKLGYECLDDLFTAGKKIMDYLVEQEKATKQYNRFVDEGRRAK